MARRRCRRIVVSDAGCDPKYADQDLANAARKIYIDLGVSIDFETMDLSARQTPPKIAAYCALGHYLPGLGGPGLDFSISSLDITGMNPFISKAMPTPMRPFPMSLRPISFLWSSSSSVPGLGAHIVELICMGGARVVPRAPPGAMSFL